MASHTYSPQAHSKAVTKYTKEKLDRIEFRVPKKSGLKAEIYAHAAKNGESVNAFIVRAVKEAMEREKVTPQDNL